MKKELVIDAEWCEVDDQQEENAIIEEVTDAENEDDWYEEYEEDESDLIDISHIDESQCNEQTLKEIGIIKQYNKYVIREQVQTQELAKAKGKLHTACAIVKKLIGGVDEIVIHIGKEKIQVSIDSSLVDWDKVNKTNYKKTSLEEERGIAQMKKIRKLYRRMLKLEKSLARTIYYKMKKIAEYEKVSDEDIAPVNLTDKCFAELKSTMDVAKAKYQNFEDNKDNVTVSYTYIKVDGAKIHIGYKKRDSFVFDYLPFDTYKDYADYEAEWYKEHGLTNWKMRSCKKKVQVEQVDVQPPKRRRGRPKGSKNKPKIVVGA